MRAPYGAQPLVRAPKARSYGTRPSLHNRAGTFASLIYSCSYIVCVILYLLLKNYTHVKQFRC